MIERFEEVLKELGSIVNLPLHPDKNSACKLSINNILHIQLELDSSREYLIALCFIAEIPPGRFREETFAAALKANHSSFQIATFAFSKKNNQLALFHQLHLANLNGEKLAIHLGQLIEIADEWRKALEGGQPLPFSFKKEKKQKNPFGL